MSFSIRAFLLRGPRREKLRRQVAGMFRVTVYLGVVAAVCSFCLVRAASARIDEAVEQFGERLLRQLGPEVIGQIQELEVNGQRVFFSSQVTERPLANVLDELSRHCESVASPALSAIADMPPAARGPLADLGDPRRLAVDRYDTEDHAVGQVACIAHAQDGANLEQVLDRVMRFVESGDLGDVGDARYFLARKLGDTRTQIISIWTEGRFDIVGMFPAEGDAPGSDSTDVPRPPSARRTFSAVVPERPYTVRVYTSRDSRETILAHYDAVMARAGWVEQPTSDGDELRVLTRAFSRGGTVAFVILDAAEEGETPVTLVEVAGKGFVQASVEEGVEL